VGSEMCIRDRTTSDNCPVVGVGRGRILKDYAGLTCNRLSAEVSQGSGNVVGVIAALRDIWVAEHGCENRCRGIVYSIDQDVVIRGLEDFRKEVGSRISSITCVAARLATNPSRVAIPQQNSKQRVAGWYQGSLVVARYSGTVVCMTIHCDVSYVIGLRLTIRSGCASLLVSDRCGAEGGFDLGAIPDSNHPVPFAVITIAANRRGPRGSSVAAWTQRRSAGLIVVADEDGDMRHAVLTK